MKNAAAKREFFTISGVRSRTKKITVDFCAEETATIKSFAMKEKQEVQVTKTFLSGKMLMFAKPSLMSFIYEMLETFCFPNEIVKKICDKKVYVYTSQQITTVLGLEFLFVSDPASDIIDKNYSYIIFEVIIGSKSYNRFDTSHNFWDRFGV